MNTTFNICVCCSSALQKNKYTANVTLKSRLPSIFLQWKMKILRESTVILYYMILRKTIYIFFEVNNPT